MMKKNLLCEIPENLKNSGMANAKTPKRFPGNAEFKWCIKVKTKLFA
jgi:hypothetical protein